MPARTFVGLRVLIGMGMCWLLLEGRFSCVAVYKWEQGYGTQRHYVCQVQWQLQTLCRAWVLMMGITSVDSYLAFVNAQSESLIHVGVAL